MPGAHQPTILRTLIVGLRRFRREQRNSQVMPVRKAYAAHSLAYEDDDSIRDLLEHALSDARLQRVEYEDWAPSLLRPSDLRQG